MAVSLVTPSSLLAGAISRVEVRWPTSNLEGGAVVLELQLEEQRKQRVRALDIKTSPTVTVASATGQRQQSYIELDVPIDLAPAYDGTIMAWGYKLRLLDANGSLLTASEVTIAAAEGEFDVMDPKPRSVPLRYSGLAEDPGLAVAEQVKIGLVAVAFAVAGAAFGILAQSEDDKLPLYLGLGFAVVAGIIAIGALSALFSRGRGLNGVVLQVDDRPIARGEHFRIDLEPPVEGMEVGLIGVELVDDSYISSGSVRNRAREHRLYEEFVPYSGSPVTLTVPEDAVLGYGGKAVALHWIVRVQSTRTKSGAGGRAIKVV